MRASLFSLPITKASLYGRIVAPGGGFRELHGQLPRFSLDAHLEMSLSYTRRIQDQYNRL